MPVQGDREFYAEVGLLTRLRHPNLVCIMGMCNEGGQKLGVFEFMPRGSLRELLDKKALSWMERVVVAVGERDAAAPSLNVPISPLHASTSEQPF